MESQDIQKISIIIPTYNRARFIARALESALKQSYPAHEILVVDDGSTDSTRQIVCSFEKRDQRVQYRYQANSGVAAARNNAIGAATGDWLAFLDSDDAWLPDKLQHAVDVIRQSSDIEFVHANKRYLFEDGQDDGREAFPSVEMTNRNYLFCHWAMKTSTVLIKRDLLARLGSLFSVRQRTCQDYELFWRAIAEAREIGYSDGCDTEITMNRGSQIRSNNGLALVYDNISAISSAARWISKRGHPAAYIDTLKQFQYWQFRTLLLIHMRQGPLFRLPIDWIHCARELSIRKASRALLSASSGVMRRDTDFFLETSA